MTVLFLFKPDFMFEPSVVFASTTLLTAPEMCYMCSVCAEDVLLKKLPRQVDKESLDHTGAINGGGYF